MEQNQIKEYLENFFLLNGCEIIEKSEGEFTTQLTIDMDKKLMNRPFYWHYLEKTGGEPNPLPLRIITKQSENEENEEEKIRGEFIHYGSPRLHQIFEVNKELGTSCCMYEKVNIKGSIKIPLSPYLLVNFKISYESNHRKDEIKSMGLDLIRGKVINSFHEKLKSIELTPKIPDFTFTLTSMVKPESGYYRLEQHIQQELENQEHEWAKEAKIKQKEDLTLLEHFYEGREKNEQYELERQSIIEQYEPKIEVEVINGALLYLT